MLGRGSAESRFPLSLFLALTITYVLLSSFVGWNENSRVLLTRSIADTGDIYLDQIFPSTVNLWTGGVRMFQSTGDLSESPQRLISDKSPGISIAFLPGYVLFRLIYEIWTEESVKGTAFPSNYPYAWLVLVLVATTIAPFMAWHVLRVRDLALANVRTRWIAQLLWISYGLGSLNLVYGGLLFPHVVGGVLAFESFLALSHRNLSTQNVRSAAILIALAPLVDYLALLLFPGLVAMAFVRKRGRYFLAWAVLASTPLLAYHYLALEDPFRLPFLNLADVQLSSKGIERDPHLADQERASGISQITDLAVRFIPRVLSLRTILKLHRLTFYPVRGIFFFWPVLLLAFVGIYQLARERAWPELVGIVVSFSVLLLCNTAKLSWWAGACYGPRYIMAGTPLLYIAVIKAWPLIDDWATCLRRSVVGFFLVAIVISAIQAGAGLGPVETLEVSGTTQNELERVLEVKKRQEALLNDFQPGLEFHVKRHLVRFFEEGPRGLNMEDVSRGYMTPRVIAGTLCVVWLLAWGTRVYFGRKVRGVN